MITLSEFIIDRQADFPYASGDLSRLLHDIGIASKIVNQQVNKAGLGDILGAQGTTNVQGEDQQKLDVYADEVFINSFLRGGEVCGIGSEENDNYVAFDRPTLRKKEIRCALRSLRWVIEHRCKREYWDHFSIFRRTSSIGDTANINDFLQKGEEQVAAGYVIYGSSTMLVYTTGHGVNGFTLEPAIGEFCLSHPSMKIPEDGQVYSINEGHLNSTSKGVQAYVDYCKGSEKKTNRPYSARYIGSFVADFHRNLIKGGIYVYPATKSAPEGKLRLLYECSPPRLHRRAGWRRCIRWETTHHGN